MKLALLVLVTSFAAIVAGCTMPYRPPAFASRDNDGTNNFPGVVDYLAPERRLDILLVHGICTHDATWANSALAQMFRDLNAQPSAVNAVTVPETDVDLYEADATTSRGRVRVSALVWSRITTPLKQQLCFDETTKSGICEGASPYPYSRVEVNRGLKDTILDDCLSDALVYEGVAHHRFRSQIQKAIIYALSEPDDRQGTMGAANVGATRPLIVVTDSLGSKIMFDAVYAMTQRRDLQKVGEQVFGRVVEIFMMANQLPILSLADQELPSSFGDPSSDVSKRPHHPLSALAAELPPSTIAIEGKRTVVAFTDPNDLLSYTLVPSKSPQGYAVIDVVVSNDYGYFGKVENPENAHLGYWNNDDVRKLLVCGNLKSGSCPK